MATSINNIFTVDIEEYFTVESFSRFIKKEEWDKYPPRVVENTDRLLNLLESYKVQGTFFVLGWIAERYPDLIKKIFDDGHEIASHGYSHKMISSMTQDEFRHDIRMSKKILEGITGCAVNGYRAPTFSIMEKTSWAYEILVEEGYCYSSSVYPIRHDRYGWPGFGLNPRQMGSKSGDKIWEIPMPVCTLGPVKIPFGGGGYIRAYPLFISKAMFRNIANSDRPCILYIHPWELDQQHPVVQAPLLSRFRHFLGIKKTENKIKELLQTFPFVSIETYFFNNNVHFKYKRQ